MTSPRVLFIGRATLDVVYSFNQFPSEDSKIFARDIRVAPGGPATNAAMTHAQLGGKALLMTAIGSGPWGAQVRDELDRLAIDIIDLAENTPFKTPLTTVLVNESGATRTIVNPPHSEVALRTMDAWDQAWGPMPALVLTDGFHLSQTLPLLKACHAAGAQICLDGGSWKPGTEDLPRLLTVAISSERFTVPGQPADPSAAIGWFAGMGVPFVAITRGNQNILACERGRRFEIEIERIDAVNTLGAGDVLHGAFCYDFAREEAFEPALRNAAAIATRSCRGWGIRGPRG